MSEHGRVAAGRKLLRPVDDGWFEEATTTQLEEGHQVPHHAQTAETSRPHPGPGVYRPGYMFMSSSIHTETDAVNVLEINKDSCRR